MIKHKIELVTMSDINEFVNIAQSAKGKVTLQDGEEYAVSAKSLLGVVAALEWNSTYVYYTDEALTNKIMKWICE